VTQKACVENNPLGKLVSGEIYWVDGTGRDSKPAGLVSDISLLQKSRTSDSFRPVQASYMNSTTGAARSGFLHTAETTFDLPLSSDVLFLTFTNIVALIL